MYKCGLGTFTSFTGGFCKQDIVRLKSITPWPLIITKNDVCFPLEQTRIINENRKEFLHVYQISKILNQKLLISTMSTHTHSSTYFPFLIWCNVIRLSVYSIRKLTNSIDSIFLTLAIKCANTFSIHIQWEKKKSKFFRSSEKQAS